MSEETALLTREETLDFVEEKLKIKNIQDKIGESPLDALNELIAAFYARFPFQNVDLLATPAAERRVPTLDDIRHSMLVSGKGGMCITMNYFTKCLLQELGYTCYLASGSARTPDDHAFVIVQDIEQMGDLHMVDMACAFPCRSAIDFRKVALEETVIQDTFLSWTVVNCGDGVFTRYHLRGDPRKILDENGVEIADGMRKRFFDFTPFEQRSFSFFSQPLTRSYTDVENSILLQALIVSYYPQDIAVSFRFGRLTIFDNAKGEIVVEKTVDSTEEYVDFLLSKTFEDVTFDRQDIIRAAETVIALQKEQLSTP